MACAAARAWNRGARRQRGAAIGREYEKVTAACGVNPFSRKHESLFGETLPRFPKAPQEIPLDAHLGPKQPTL
jgi:hypothetical protein